MKFVQLIEYPKNYAKNEAEKLVPDRFLSFKKALYQVKASGLQLDFTKKLYTIDPEIAQF